MTSEHYKNQLKFLKDERKRMKKEKKEKKKHKKEKKEKDKTKKGTSHKVDKIHHSNKEATKISDD